MNIPSNNWAIHGATNINVVGNGSGETPELEHDQPFIRFNLSNDIPLSPLEVRVSNQRVIRQACESSLFQVLSLAMNETERDGIQRLLTLQSTKLDAELGCPPSTGIATVHTCLSLGLSLSIFRMPLRPPLLRASELAPRYPLPAAFHNWLGEQRIAWRLISAHKERLRWSDMTTKLDNIDSEEGGVLNPYPSILGWMKNAARRGPDTNDQVTLIELTTSPRFNWGRHANHEYLRQLEPFLYLDRARQETRNWWLYSNSLSTAIDLLLGRLSHAQQRLYLEQAAC